MLLYAVYGLAATSAIGAVWALVQRARLAAAQRERDAAVAQVEMARAAAQAESAMRARAVAASIESSKRLEIVIAGHKAEITSLQALLEHDPAAGRARLNALMGGGK